LNSLPGSKLPERCNVSHTRPGGLPRLKGLVIRVHSLLKGFDGHAASPRNLIAAVRSGSPRSSGAAAHVVWAARHLAGRSQTLQDACKPIHTDPQSLADVWSQRNVVLGIPPKLLIFLRSLGDSNPCFRRERARSLHLRLFAVDLRSEDLAAGGDVGYGVEDRLFYQGAAPFKARRRLETVGGFGSELSIDRLRQSP
jgi:hypothetical protein